MYNLAKHERAAAIILISALVLGLAVTAWKRSHPDTRITVERFNLESGQDSSCVGFESMEKININKAGPEELMRLKGVGRTLAERIITHRSQNGAFRSADEIKDVKGIGEKLFNSIKDHITTD